MKKFSKEENPILDKTSEGVLRLCHTLQSLELNMTI